MNSDDKTLNVGDQSVVMGKVRGNVGSRSVVIGATDERGNTIINQPMAVGFGARAAPGSIAIGSYACAGSERAMLLEEMSNLVAEKNPELIETYGDLVNLLNDPKQDQSKVRHLWGVIEKCATAAGAIDLVSKFTRVIIGS